MAQTVPCVLFDNLVTKVTSNDLIAPVKPFEHQNCLLNNCCDMRKNKKKLLGCTNKEIQLNLDTCIYLDNEVMV